MKTKKTIIQLLVLSGIAISLSACGQSNYKSSRVPTSSAAGGMASPLQGYWVSSCSESAGINTQLSIEFNGNTYTQYDDQFNSSNCSDPEPFSTTMSSGTFTLVNQSYGTGYGNTIDFTPTSGTLSSSPLEGYEQYVLTGNSLQFVSVDQTGYTNADSPIYTLYTGN